MLYIVATPIGNLEDITLRALRVLKEADFILAEDTRKTGILLKHFQIKKKLVSLYEHSEVRKIPRIIEELKKGKTAALVSNAGTPTISDPGYKLLRECRKHSLPITSVPGPSSVINALALTSLPHERFAFLGYLPRKRNGRRKLLRKIKGWNLPVVFFESPQRLVNSFQDLWEVLGNRQVAVLREMTKKFEEVFESDLKEAHQYFQKNKPKGEFTLIVEPHLTVQNNYVALDLR